MKVVVKRTLRRIVKIKYTDAGLEVLANCFVTRRRIRNILDDNLQWIKTQQSQHSQVDRVCQVDNVGGACEQTVTKNFAQNIFDVNTIRDVFVGSKIVICGDVVKVRSTVENKTYQEGNVVYIPEKNYLDKDLRLHALRVFVKKLSVGCVADEISQFGSYSSLCPAKIEFKDLHDRWCNCVSASQKCICLNYKISQLPSHLRRYVIAHAFAHFGNKSHDENYCRRLHGYVPEYVELDSELDGYRFLLDV